MGSGALLSFVARNFDVLAAPFVTLVYPLYASVRAIESASPVDDQQWLTYWVLYSLLTLFELTFSQVIGWIPFWSYAKLIFNCWLVLPYFNGAAFIYDNYVRPVVLNQQGVLWSATSGSSSFSKPDNLLLAAEKFIEENGTKTFEEIISKAGGVSKSKKSKKRVTFYNEGNARKESKLQES
ncbi:HVA22-like protein a [Zingiber officinale]|uniref:HVA22-like protein n=1 Tax=Zingiber officinale TaxID=94328 RepID=A0A8J5FC50_ZINOF|nr:HVA22-like protein a [Zingiber officinale]KAG6484120.1 hypothetical protein ZIOFF_060914 [Zingiber officinale]